MAMTVLGERSRMLGAEKGESGGWRRWARFLAVASVLLVVGFLAGGRIYLGLMTSGRLEGAVARLDREEPGWRAADIEAARATPDPARDGAKEVLAVARLIPPTWPGRRAARNAGAASEEGGWLAVGNALRARDPADPLPIGPADELRAEAEALLPAIARAMTLAATDGGRFKASWRGESGTTDRGHLVAVQRVAELLWIEAISRAEAGETDEAASACSALLRVGRAIGDEPLLDAQMARSRVARTAVHALQWALSRGPITEARSADLRSDLAVEAAHPGLSIAAKGERAREFELFERLAAGGSGVGDGRESRSPTSVVRWFYVGPLYRYNAGIALDAMTDAGQRLADPPARRRAALAAWGERVKGERTTSRFGRAAYLILPPMAQAADELDETRAILAAAVNALAAAQRRGPLGRWPTTVAELSPDPLRDPVPDPIDGRPIRLATSPGGVKFYSVGVDARDDGGLTEPSTAAEPRRHDDVGFRLFDTPRPPASASPRASGPSGR